jgi:tRNA A-37 threonylcarbamoyl transferase component Bud32
LSLKLRWRLAKVVREMAVDDDYKVHWKGDWQLLVFADEWTGDCWDGISTYLVTANSVTRRRPETQKITDGIGEAGQKYFLKIYYPDNYFESLKDLFRRSKAFRALRQGQALRRNGFEVPVTVVAGERRRLGFIRLAFLLAHAVEGVSLPVFLRTHSALSLDGGRLKTKRAALRQLALEVRCMHQLGFVHGDLIPSNILIRQEPTGIRIISIDHDRTRRYPPWFPQGFWKRNLVQLNRFNLPGISVRDRIRFLRHYLGCRSLGQRERRLARWLDRRTKERRREIQLNKKAMDTKG